MKRRTIAAAALALVASAVVTGTSVGTSNAASADLKISEFRLRGPAGANDEFVELYNPTSGPVTVAVDDGSSGWALVASDGVARFVVPNGTVIPARGHYLGVNSAWSDSAYPAGNGTTATGDATYAADIADNAGIALFRTSNPANFTLANRSDAVGSTSEANALYKEGVGYPAIVPFSIDSSFTRNEISGTPADTDNNAADFLFVDTNGTSAGAGQRLGAPGPENLSSPVQMNGSLPITKLDPGVDAFAGANMVRDFTSDPAHNSTFGTITLRRTVTNNTGAPVTRLRVRTPFVQTFPSPSGVADLRGRTSTTSVVPLSGGGTATVDGTTQEQPPAQPNGSGFNGTFSDDTITLATPLAAGASVNLAFLFGIQQTGTFNVTFNVEALPAAGTSGAAKSMACDTEGCAAVNVAPVATDDGASTPEDTPLHVAAAGVLANDTDADGDPIHAVLGTDVTHGTLALNADGSYDYTPAANFHGTDTFTYHANDGMADSNVATVTITVDPVNDAPVATDDVASTPEDVALHVAAPGVLANDSDVDGDTITAVLDTDVSHGTLVLNADGSYDYTPAANFHGTDTFTYHDNDGTTDGNVATVTITVDPVNDPPFAVADAYNVNEDTVLTGSVATGVLANDSDVDGDTITAVLDTTTAQGTLVLNGDGSFTYTPNADFNGTDSFTYHDNDGTTAGNVVTVSITVNPVNDAPVANDDAVSVSSVGGTATVSVLGDDTDVDSDILSVSSWTNGAKGSVTCSSTQCMYSPDPSATGEDSFTYVVSDGHGGTAVGTVHVTLISGVAGVVFNNSTTPTLPLTGSNPLGLVAWGSGLVGAGLLLLRLRRVADAR